MSQPIHPQPIHPQPIPPMPAILRPRRPTVPQATVPQAVVPARRWHQAPLALTAALAAALGCGGLAVHLWLDGGGVAVQAVPAVSDPPPGPDPHAQQHVFLVRSTLMALNDANRSGNYSVLRDLAGPRFRQRNSAESLAAVFAAFRRAGIDLSPAGMTLPTLDSVTMDGDGAADSPRALNLRGRVPGATSSAAPAIRFAMAFEPVEGHWRLLTLSVGIEPARLAGLGDAG